MRLSKKESSVITIIGCIFVQVCAGIIYVWSVMKTASMDYYGWDSGAVNLVSSFNLLCFSLGNFFGGALNDRIGPKKVNIMGCLMLGAGILLSSFIKDTGKISVFYITYCVIGGLGAGFAYGSNVSCLQKWLPHKLGLATGIATSAFGLSTVIFAPVITRLLLIMEMPSMLRTLAAVFLVIGLFSCLFVKLPSAEYLSRFLIGQGGTVGPKDIPLGRAVKFPVFWVIFFFIFFYNGTWNMMLPILKTLGMDRGLTDALAVTLVSLTGVTNTFGRFAVAAVSDKLGRPGTLVTLATLVGICALLFTFVGSVGYMAAALLCAFAVGGQAGMNPALTSDFFGIKYSGANYGIIMISIGMSSVVFNAISNKMVYMTDSYVLTFIMGAATAATAVILMLITGRALKKKRAADMAGE